MIINKDDIGLNRVDSETDATDALHEKLGDAETTPGFVVEFDPDEAEKVGAFVEDALSEAEALESSADLLDHG
jgi:hypothetical protein